MRLPWWRDWRALNKKMRRLNLCLFNIGQGDIAIPTEFGIAFAEWAFSILGWPTSDWRYDQERVKIIHCEHRFDGNKYIPDDSGYSVLVITEHPSIIEQKHPEVHRRLKLSLDFRCEDRESFIKLLRTFAETIFLKSLEQASISLTCTRQTVANRLKSLAKLLNTELHTSIVNQGRKHIVFSTAGLALGEWINLHSGIFIATDKFTYPILAPPPSHTSESQILYSDDFNGVLRKKDFPDEFSSDEAP